MSSLSDPWKHLSTSGKIILPLVALLVLGVVALTVALGGGRRAAS